MDNVTRDLYSHSPCSSITQYHDHMSLFALSQILIGVAICTDILSFQFKKRTHILYCLLVSCVMISLHFVCLGHWTAAALGLVAATRFSICLHSTSRKVLWLFLGITVGVTVLTYDGLLSLLGCSGALFGTVASFNKNDQHLRQIMAIGTSLWLVHNILAGSPGAVVMEVIFLSSNLVGYFRYYIRPQKQVIS